MNPFDSEGTDKIHGHVVPHARGHFERFEKTLGALARYLVLLARDAAFDIFVNILHHPAPIVHALQKFRRLLDPAVSGRRAVMSRSHDVPAEFVVFGHDDESGLRDVHVVDQSVFGAIKGLIRGV